MTENETAQFESLLALLKRNRGFDFTGYKRPTLIRRVQKRMMEIGITDFSHYSDYLEVHPDEFEQLFDTILINVTAFLRDPAAWEALRDQVVPELAQLPADRPIRVWSAGCASGEETYTILMVLSEELGIEQVKNRVKLYATDADAQALARARAAVYDAKALAPLPEEWRAKYFEESNGGYSFRADLRRNVIFGEHDLVQDAPISRLDLLVCRNTMIYFNAETQARLLARMNFALRDDGYLFLGKSEMLLTHSRLFLPIDGRERIFTKVKRVSEEDRLLAISQAPPVAPAPGSGAHLADLSFDAGGAAQLVIDRSGILILANRMARGLLGIAKEDIGRPFRDHDISYRPIELRSRIDEAYKLNRPVTVRDAHFPESKSQEQRYFDVEIAPLADESGSALAVAITFSDVTAHHRLRMETAYEELQATNEELETTNEELQSTIEELETTNEELQSTNEELETLNAELQSANEELENINEELRRRTGQIDEMNDFLETVMTSIKASVVVLDPELRVIMWNDKSADLWGLRSDDVEGKRFFDLDIGLPVDQLAQSVHAAGAGKKEFQETFVDAINRRGRPIRCRVTATALTSPRGESRGVILFLEEWQR